MGFTRVHVYTVFLISALSMGCWYSFEPPQLEKEDSQSMVSVVIRKEDSISFERSHFKGINRSMYLTGELTY